MPWADDRSTGLLEINFTFVESLTAIKSGSSRALPISYHKAMKMSFTIKYLLTGIAISLFSSSAICTESAAAGNIQKISGTNLQSLDQLFSIPLNKNIFDKRLWAGDRASRKQMLFDLYHSTPSTQTIEQTIERLGQPLETVKDTSNNRTLLYDIGAQFGLPTFFGMFFRGDKLESCFIQLKSDTPINFDYEAPDWVTENCGWESLAKEYNQHAFVVGMPTKCISAMSGRIPTVEEALHIYGPFQFELTPDQEKVKKFRISYASALGAQDYTAWEEEDLRTDPRSFTRESEYRNLMWLRQPLMAVGMPFSKEAWSPANERQFNRRNGMVGGFVRSHAVIGMSRKTISELLGPSVNRTVDGEIDDVADYPLYAAMCGNAGINSLQILFKDDKAVGYRVYYHQGEGYKDTKFFNGASYGFEDAAP